jgi:hypothetical protein
MQGSFDSCTIKKKELLVELKLFEKKYEVAKNNVTFYNKKADDAQRRVVEAFERNEPYHSYERYASHMRNYANKVIKIKINIEKKIEDIQKQIKDCEELICFFEMSKQFCDIMELCKSDDVNNKTLQIENNKLYSAQAKKLDFEK